MAEEPEHIKNENDAKPAANKAGKNITEKKGDGKTVKELMTVNLLTASPDITLKEANQLMKIKQTRHIMITGENKKLLGILSDRDIKRFVSPFANTKIADTKDKATLELKLGQIMTHNPVTISPEQSIRDCIELMLEKSISALPVIDESKKLAGIITTTNILKYFLTIVK